MEQKLMQAVIGILVALMAWNFNTVQGLTVAVEGMMYKHASETDIQALKLEVERMKWILQEDSQIK